MATSPSARSSRDYSLRSARVTKMPTPGVALKSGLDAVLFLDDQSIFSLLVQLSVGRTVMLLVGTIAEPGLRPRDSCSAAGTPCTR
jgi:hypothetical protein